MTRRERPAIAGAVVWGVLFATAHPFAVSAQEIQLASSAPRFVSAPVPSRRTVDVSNAPAFQRRVTLDLDRVTLRTALDDIGRQARLRFVASDEVVPLEMVVSMSAARITVAAALTDLLIGHGVDVQLSPDGGTVALIPRSGATSNDRQPQPANGTIAGHVNGPGNHPLAGAVVHVSATRLGAQTGPDGAYRIGGVPAGTYVVLVRLLGFAPDSASVTVAAGPETQHDFTLRESASQLERITVTGQRLGESKEAAVERQQNADNIVTVLSGDEIRGLPNANAAEGAARIPGVTTERDEGEGKFIEVRGTEPRLSNVTIDGAHVPGTQFGQRIPKVDAIPSDILAAIEVSKTLTADMDADAIGGSVNFVTKTPVGAPRGYVSGQAGQTTLLSHRQWQGGVSYGGRFGDHDQLGFLLGTSLDHNDRVISDVEPAWAVDGAGNVFPTEWSQREFLQNRSRFGVGGDLDYRYGDNGSVFLKGLFSEFHNFGYRYQYDVSFSGDSAPVAGSTSGIGTGAALFREVQNRTPREVLYALTAGGKNHHGALTLDYAFNWAGTRQSARDYRFNPFNCIASSCPTALSYDFANRLTPTYQYLSAADAAAAVAPANFALTGYKTFDSFTSGRDLGGGANVLWAYDVGSNSGGLKFGVKMRDEDDKYNQNRYSYSTGASLGLLQAMGRFTDPNYYHYVTNAYQLGPLPDNGAAVGFVDSHQFTATHKDSVANAVASFNGSEKIYSAYAMNTLDIGIWRLNLGLRVENTHSSYTGHAATTPVDTLGNPTGPTTITTVPGSQTYTDLFPSGQLRLAVGPATNLRLAITRGIARPNYADLAPSLVASIDAVHPNHSSLSAGNPNLRPQHAWNYDLLFEHFLPVGGVVSGGVFYKSITDLILSEQFVYNGPVTALDGIAGTEPKNAGSGHMLGFEGDWTQHLIFLPGPLSGVGFDVNWTHVDSRAAAPSATPGVTRPASLPRQAQNLANVALLYDIDRLSARVAWQYQGENIFSYGDGSSSPVSGDIYFSPHSQIDGSVIVNVTRNVQVQLQGLNLNNAVFGFYVGTPKNSYNIQREFYGRSLILGAKYAF